MKAPDPCVWIGSDHPFDLQETYLWFMADLDLAAPPRSARCHLTADSRYRLWINGDYVGRGPERSWPTAMAVDARDVTDVLRPGHNRIAVQVYSPGYSHFAHVHRAACGLIGWLDIDGQTALVTDRDRWRVRRDLSYSPRVPRVSIYGTGVEDRDIASATTPLSDCSDWAQPRIVQPPEGPIWASLRARTTPLLAEEHRLLLTPVETRFGPSLPPSEDPHDHLRQGYAALPKAPIPETLPAGHSAIWVFDLGESRVTVAEATLTAGAGDMLCVSYAEKRRGDDILLPDPATYCRMRPTDRYRLAAGRSTVEGFTLRGGRFLIFQLDAQAPVTPAPAFHARLPAYPLDLRDTRPERDPTLAAVQAICQRTTLACLQDGFVDSVWRESSQWLGDVVAQAFALAAISDDARPLRLAIEQAAAGAALDGILPSVLPGDVPAYVVTDYNFSWVELLAFWHEHPNGDTDLLAQHWPALIRLLDRFDADRAADGLIRSQPGRRLFLDWSAMDRAEPNLTYNLRYLHALQTAQRLAAATGLEAPATWNHRARQLSDAIRAAHHRADGWQESPTRTQASQLALAFLILTNLVPPAEAARLADAIEARSLDPDDTAKPGAPALASPFMHHYLFLALHRLGRNAAIRRIIALRWGRWAQASQPNTWENWTIDFPDGSACHGFSAHPLGWLSMT
ncbi:MAG: hypothetical protein JNK19_11290 [Tabrizicola sp.]|nr:hypothetical protein [Tabrizicola sp.]